MLPRPRIAGGLLAAALILAAATSAQAQPSGPIMPLDQVQASMQCQGLTVVQGTTISSFDVRVLGVVQEYGEEGSRILISVSGPAVASTGIAEGFSGSPVLCPGSAGTMETIGAISQGVGQYGNDVGLVTPIQAMLGEPVTPPPDVAKVDFRTRPLSGPLTVSGLDPPLTAQLQRAAAQAGRRLVAAPSTSPPPFPVQTLVPGASIVAQYSTGTIAMGAVGTVTYTDGPDVYAFGHELDGAGRRSLPMADAWVYDVIDDPDTSEDQTSYKLAAPGHLLGSVTSDTPNGIIGAVGTAPATVPIDVTAHDGDTGSTISEESAAADESDIGDPLGSSEAELVAPLAAAQAATDVYDGAPANESGRLCLTIGVRGIHAPLHLCKRYVGSGSTGTLGAAPPALALDVETDTQQAVSLIGGAAFRPLHITRVRANIDAARGLRKAEILSASGPKAARAGSRIRVRLTIRPYQAPLRHVTLRVRIPMGLSGPVRIIIGQTRQALADEASQELISQLSASVTGALGGLLGGSAPSGPSPESIAHLRKAFQAIAPYDGIVARIGRLTGPHLYRDPKLLIEGDARLTVDLPLPKGAKRGHAKHSAPPLPASLLSLLG